MIIGNIDVICHPNLFIDNIIRSLMGGDNFFNSVTHIIIDEVHERDKMCDFLLTILKVIQNTIVLTLLRFR